MHSTPSLRPVRIRRRALATRMSQEPQHVLAFESNDVVDNNVSRIANESAEQHRRITRLSSQATMSDSSVSSSEQSLILPPTTTPSPSMNNVPTSSPVYLESQRLMDSILAISCIILHSYVLAYDRVYGGPQSHVQFYHYAKTPRGSLLRRLLLGRRTGLVSAEEFLQYGIRFPALTPSPGAPPLPPRFEVPVLRYPRIYKIPMYPVDAPSIMLKQADWDTQVQEFLDYYRLHVYDPRSSASSSRGGHGRSLEDRLVLRHLDQPPIFPLRREVHFYRNAREIRPLPRRARAAAAQAQASTVLGVVARTVVDVGSVIVRGVKRLKDGLEDGGILKKRRVV